MPTAAFLLVALLLAAGSVSAQGASVTVVGEPAQCERTASVQIWIRTTYPRQPQPAGRSEGMVVQTNLKEGGAPLETWLAFVDGHVAGGKCEWPFKGLRAGEYVAFLYRPDGSGGARTFSIAANSTLTVRLPGPTVVLSGRVLRTGVGIPGVIVRVRSLPFWRPSITTFTDADGRYRVLLDAPGNHEVMVDLVDATARAEGRLHEGENQLDVTVR